MKLFPRVILDLAIAIAVINGWWSVAVVLILVGAWYFQFFVEMIIAGVAYDALFGMVHGMGLRGYMGTIGAVIILVVVKFVKRLVR